MQHTEICLLTFFYFFTLHASLKTSKQNSRFTPRKKGPIRSHAPLSRHRSYYFAASQMTPWKRTNHAIAPYTTFTPSRQIFCCFTNHSLKKGQITPSRQSLWVPLLSLHSFFRGKNTLKQDFYELTTYYQYFVL